MGLIWLDCFKRDSGGDWRVSGIMDDPSGYTKESLSVSSIPSEIIQINSRSYRSHTIRTTLHPFSWFDLTKSDRLLYPLDVLQKFSPGVPLSDSHAIYKIGDEYPVYVPAFLLIRALFMGSSLLDRFLLVPNAPEMLGIALKSCDEVYVKTSRSVRTVDLCARLSRVLTWMLTKDDASKAHASILNYAREGRIDIDIPKVSMSGWAYGIDIGVGLLATEISALDIHYPLPLTRITVQVKNKIKSFPSYEPPVRTSWLIDECKDIK